MKLITKELERKFKKYPIYSQEDKGYQSKILCKFFNPCGSATWYVTEAEKQGDNDYLFFGLVDLWGNKEEAELGYFTLNQLKEIKLPWGLTIERDLYFHDCTIEDIKKRQILLNIYRQATKL